MHVNIPLPLASETICFLIDMGLLCNYPTFLGSVIEIIIALEPYGIFKSNFACIDILTLSSHSGLQNGDKGLLSIILAGHGLLMKMLIPLEPHVIL